MAVSIHGIAGLATRGHGRERGRLGRLCFFAKATGQDDPVYCDEAAARAAGHPALPVPPTFLFCLEMESTNPAAIRNLLGMDYRRLLHGEQQFTYHGMAYAGDVLTFSQQIEDIWQFFYRGAYWRRGPVTMSAIAAVATPNSGTLFSGVSSTKYVDRKSTRLNSSH